MILAPVSAMDTGANQSYSLYFISIFPQWSTDFLLLYSLNCVSYIVFYGKMFRPFNGTMTYESMGFQDTWSLQLLKVVRF